MDEPDLRQIITSASKILIPKFDEIKDAATRIVLVLEEIDYDQFVVDLGLATSKDEKDYPRKNIQVTVSAFSPNFSGEVGLNLAFGMDISCCSRQSACWRPACCWLGSMSIGDPSKSLGWEGGFQQRN